MKNILKAAALAVLDLVLVTLFLVICFGVILVFSLLVSYLATFYIHYLALLGIGVLVSLFLFLTFRMHYEDLTKD